MNEEISYLDFYYKASPENWFDIWCLLLGFFTLIYSIYKMRRLLTYIIYLWLPSEIAQKFYEKHRKNLE